MNPPAAAPLPAGPAVVVMPDQPQHGRLISVGPQGATILWDMGPQVAAIHGGRSRQRIMAELDDVAVTEGLQGQWECRPSDEPAEPRVAVRFRIEAPFAVPGAGQPLVLPPDLRAVAVTAANGDPILVKRKGRLVFWRNWDAATRRGGFGVIRAFAQHGGTLKLSTDSSNLMAEDGLPASRDVRPVLDQAVSFTARHDGHRPRAERVTALGGGPVLVREVEEGEEEDGYEDME